MESSPWFTTCGVSSTGTRSPRRCFANGDLPHIPSVTGLWPAANWHEREAFDLFGIVFDGHPNLKRILMADDWVGFPLRKDYVFPREYHGIPASVELDWPTKVCKACFQ